MNCKIQVEPGARRISLEPIQSRVSVASRGVAVSLESECVDGAIVIGGSRGVEVSTPRGVGELRSGARLRVELRGQGIAGPVGPVGTGVEHLEPRIQTLEEESVRCPKEFAW